MKLNNHDIYLPFDAIITERHQESKHIFTLGLEFTDHNIQQQYSFAPGQFNMLYLFGVGEIALSIISAPQSTCLYSHTIRRVGRVTQALSLLQVGDHVGIRGPFGNGWPLKKAEGKDILVITGGLGCVPSVSIIDEILKHRDDFGRLFILQGVKHSDDFIFRKQYEKWKKAAGAQILLAADITKPDWPWYTGYVNSLIEKVNIDPNNTLCMMCGPETMMITAVKQLTQLQLTEENIYLNLDRNMECAIGHCGHCQFDGKFICKDGPVFSYDKIKHILGKKGF